MGKIIDLREYKSFRRSYRLIQVDTVKSTIEKYRIGDFFGKSEEEVQRFYEDLADKLNDMVETPNGTTAFEVGNLLAEYSISPRDFDMIFDMIKTTSKEVVNNDTKTEPIIETEFGEGDLEETRASDTEYYEIYLDLGDEEVEGVEEGLGEYAKEEEVSEEFLREASESLDKYVATIEEEMKEDKKTEKASKPYKVVTTLAKNFSENIAELSGKQEYKSTSPRIAESLAKLFGRAKTLEKKSKESKPKFKSGFKKIVDFKSKKKKGFMQGIKEKSEAKKAKKTRNVIDRAKETSEALVRTYQKRAHDSEVKLPIIKSLELNRRLSFLRGDYKLSLGEASLEDIEKAKSFVTQERQKQIASLFEALDTIQTGKLKTDLARQTKLSEKEISMLLYDGYVGTNEDNALVKVTTSDTLGIDENGNLQISNAIPLKVEDIKGTELEEELRRYALMPKLGELTDEEILQLSKAIRVQDGKIRVNFSYLFDGNTPGNLSWVSEKVPIFANRAPESKKEFNQYVKAKGKVGTRLQLFKNLYGNTLYLDGMESVIPDALDGYEDIGVYDKLLKELEEIEQLNKAKILNKQILDIEDRATDLEESGKLTRKEKRTRQDLRKVAEKKVFELEKQGIDISDKISRNETIEESLLAQGSRKLNLDRAIDAGDKKMNKIKSQDEK